MIRTTLASMLLPPVGAALVAFLALLLLPHRAGRRVALAALAMLIVCAMPVTEKLLTYGISPGDPVQGGPTPQAIVILSGDVVRIPGAVEYEPGVLTMERLRAGAALQRRTGLPILVSGGTIVAKPVTLAAMMTESLTEDFHATVRWQEARSTDTWENAEFSTAILRADGVTRAYVVTQDWHMRRALAAFRQFGMDVVPAPVRSGTPAEWLWSDLLPRPTTLLGNYFAIHEWVGLVFYRLRG